MIEHSLTEKVGSASCMLQPQLTLCYFDNDGNSFKLCCWQVFDSLNYSAVLKLL
jgi:hypothetical protein